MPKPFYEFFSPVKILAGHLWRTRVLDQSWEEARDALIEETPMPEPLLSRLRRLSLGRGTPHDEAPAPAADEDGEPAEADTSFGE